MPAESGRSNALFALALLAAIVATIWAIRTPVAPNSDRYDYVGRAQRVLDHQSPSGLVVYPLRFAFDGHESIPVRNLTRPPLWPTTIAPALRLGAGAVGGVVASALLLFALLALVRIAADRAFGAPAGGFAALALVSSFATWRALWGGGPEIALALLLHLGWTWNARGRRAGWVLGGLAGLLPWLHPIGWLHAPILMASRAGRTAPRALVLATAVALAVGLPWYVTVGQLTGRPLAPLQAAAELAKAVEDPVGLGPYRTLEPRWGADLLRERPRAVLRSAASNARHLAPRLGAWLAWPLLFAAALGARRDRWLAARDASLLLLAAAVVVFFARDPRLLFPLLPVAATWAGAGLAALDRKLMPRLSPLPVLALVALPWPLSSSRPGSEIVGVAHERLAPPTDVVRAVSELSDERNYLIVDSAALAWRARRPSVLVPADPDALERLRAQPVMRGATRMVVWGPPSESPWLSSPAWEEWIVARAGGERIGRSDYFVLELDPPTPAPFVPPPVRLGPGDEPDSLVGVGVPPAARDGLRLTAPAARSLLALFKEARAAGTELRIVSAHRSFARQQELYRAARRRHGDGQNWVAEPGRSEHQLGTAVDFADGGLQFVLVPDFERTEASRWLEANAGRHGWRQSYTQENADSTGYAPEPWHYRWYPAGTPEDPRP